MRSYNFNTLSQAERLANLMAKQRVAEAFNPDALRRICEMHEDEFAEVYGMQTVQVAQREPDNFYYYKDNGKDILAVAHLDTVVRHVERQCNFVETEAGTVVFSGALDDRLGAYIILDLLPALDIEFDLLLTVGEESGASTAQFFEPHKDKHYNWMIEFDRGGTDVVSYQYEDKDLNARVRAAGAKMSPGIFSDISYLEHLEIKGLNWGVGYQDYHGPRSHAFLEDTFDMVAKFLKFHEQNKDEFLPHEEDPHGGFGWGRSSRWGRSTYIGDGEDEYVEHEGQYIPLDDYLKALDEEADDGLFTEDDADAVIAVLAEDAPATEPA